MFKHFMYQKDKSMVKDVIYQIRNKTNQNSLYNASNKLFRKIN